MLTKYQAEISLYLQQKKGLGLNTEYQITPLACGEYNINYLLTPITGEGQSLVFRINMASQIGREDQIIYEYNSLKILENTGLTPRPLWVDDSREFFDRGILVMEFLPGTTFDYRQDSKAAARLFAQLHSYPIDGPAHLIQETAPLSLIYNECSSLLAKYFTSPLSDKRIAAYLQQVLSWMKQHLASEEYFQAHPWNCMVNTEVNSGNFIVNGDHIFLIDWEMPRWGDPSTDLCHFLSPLTTLWKSAFRFDTGGQRAFIEEYLCHINNPLLSETLHKRMRLKMPYVLLRGISWSAMAHVAYRENFDGIRNEDTWTKLCLYMNLDFIESLFSPYLDGEMQ